jgi:hypothetical protein
MSPRPNRSSGWSATQEASRPISRSLSRHATAVVCSSNVLTVSQPSRRGSPIDTSGSFVLASFRKRGRGTTQAYAARRPRQRSRRSGRRALPLKFVCDVCARTKALPVLRRRSHLHATRSCRGDRSTRTRPRMREVRQPPGHRRHAALARRLGLTTAWPPGGHPRATAKAPAGRRSEAASSASRARKCSSAASVESCTGIE